MTWSLLPYRSSLVYLSILLLAFFTIGVRTYRRTGVSPTRDDRFSPLVHILTSEDPSLFDIELFIELVIIFSSIQIISSHRHELFVFFLDSSISIYSIVFIFLIAPRQDPIFWPWICLTSWWDDLLCFCSRWACRELRCASIKRLKQIDWKIVVLKNISVCLHL